MTSPDDFEGSRIIYERPVAPNFREMNMHTSAYRALALLFTAGLILAGCSQSQEAPPAQTAPMDSPPPQVVQPNPPHQQPLSLFMVPLNPNDFSMQAIQANKKRVEEKPDDVQALVSLGDANFMIQRFEVAQDYYERAVKADPNQINAHLSLSNCYLFLQKPDQAIQQLDDLLKTNKDYPEALFNKGLILLKSKQDTIGAKQNWTQLVNAHPEHYLAQQVKDELSQL
jgi:tetratricopeptide (TPR) repeat protein